MRRLCSTSETFQHHSQELAKHFRERGYPESLVERSLEKAANTAREDTLAYRPKLTNSRIPMVVTYNPRNPPIRQWMRDKLSIAHNSPRMISAMPEVPVLGEKKCHSLRSLLMPSQLPSPPINDLVKGVFKCQSTCIVCAKHLVEGSQFKSSNTK